jgi:hypothetical protein
MKLLFANLFSALARISETTTSNCRQEFHVASMFFPNRGIRAISNGVHRRGNAAKLRGATAHLQHCDAHAPLFVLVPAA